MIPSATTVPAGQLSDADLYESYRNRGLGHADAVLHVERRRMAANQPPVEGPTTHATTPLGAAITGAARTATSGFADELTGALEAMRGNPPQNSAQRWFGALGGKDVSGPLFDQARYVQARDQIRTMQNQALVEHPAVSLGAGFLGAQANPLNYLLGPLSRFMTPAQKGLTFGTTFGAAQGAGEGETPLGRTSGAIGGAVAGAIGGTALGAVGGAASKYWANLWKSVGPLFGRTQTAVMSTMGKTVPEDVINGLTESSVRARLTKDGFTQSQMDHAVAMWRNGGKPPAPPQPVAPTNLRPGESLTPIPDQPRGFAVTGTRATPPVPTAPTLAEMQGFNTTPRLPDIGTGKTLPYYPRGGMVEQALGQPPPVSSPPGPSLAPNQQAAFLSFLKGASPEDAASRVGTLRALGVPLPPTAETDLLALLHGGLLK